MTGNKFLSNEEYLQRQDIIKARQQRIIQVREQSKKMAAKILNRMKLEADRQYQQAENRVLSEIRQHYSRELASVRQHYHQCINDINQQHYVNHANTLYKCHEKRKQPLRIPKNEGNAKPESLKQVSKKLPQSQIVETVLNKSEIDSVTTKKTTVPSSVAPKTNFQKFKKSVAEKVPHLPENIIIKPKETDIEFSRNSKQSSFPSPRKQSCNVKKSVNFVNKENYDIDKPHILTSPIKRYPADTKKPTFPSSHKTKMNVITEQQRLDDFLEEHDGNEIYNILVHDRIRVLEQKEKILHRQSISAPSVSNSILMHKPVTFSDYFSNVRISVAAPKHPAVNNELRVDNSQKKSSKESKGVSTDEISYDVDRVQMKKKLLVLELTNAETQTDKNISSNSDSTSNGSNEETMEQNAESKKLCVPSPKNSPKKIISLSPIPKDENVDRKNFQSKKPKRSEDHRYKQLLKNNDVTVTVSTNPASVSTNGSDSTSAPKSYPSESSTESTIAQADRNHSHKTVQVIVNVLSDPEFKEKLKSQNRQKKVSYIQESEFQKVPDWRKLFDNEEKMTESSYFSPPEVVLKKQRKVHSAKTRSKTVKPVIDEKSPGLGYYVQKLLLMRPESIENLDVSSSSTAPREETVQISNNKSQKKTRIKLPLYQNSFDDTSFVKKSSKVPYYQNSFNDTIDAVCDFVLKSQCSDILSNDTCSVEDESIEVLTRGNDDQNSSSVSDLFQFPAENFVPPASILKKFENTKSPQNLSDPSSANILRSVESERLQNETDDQIKLPSMEELCKRGFVSEQLLNQNSTDEQETMEEEEFLQQLLTINHPKTNKKLARHLDFKSIPHDASKISVPQNVKEPVDEVDAAAPTFGHKSKTPSSELKNESRLLGWMDTTVQRTLQASAINSTSSGDSSDPVRHTYQMLENLIEEPFDKSENNSSFHKHFTLSPIKVPDVHLTISPVLKDSE